ncbi:hypothetical protein AB6A40_003334 [Gnathostoma spinigerum]|uniref:Protein kinase domain-containing protein n=1 Tax=Gnathostoma spinigerum TaxID=75299 RepID=A0ABD6E990_9BILA
MSSVLSSFFSRDPKSIFGYDLAGAPVYSYNGISMSKSFKKAEPAETACCFVASTSEVGGSGSLLKAQAQKLKTLRHPNVLTYIDSIEVDNKFYLITEPCVPLSVYVNSARLVGSQKEFVVSWGLYQVMNCLKFLHNEAKLSHENLRRAVYVTPAGDWKLSGFEYSTAFSSVRSDLSSLAIVIWEIFNGFNENISKPQAPGNVPKRLQDFYKKIASSNVSKLSAEELINEYRRPRGFMKNRFVDILLFLEEFQLKESHDKQIFFSKLKDDLDIFPDDFAKHKILPKLIESYEYGDAGSSILLPMFKLGRLLDADEYQRCIVPCLCKLFSSSDRITRLKLLEKIDEIAPNLSPDVINDKVYGNLASGFLDTNPALRDSTVKAVVSLAEKLNYYNLNTDLMKYLARLQGCDDQPGIRTNTTICLGKIGCYIDPSQRQRILISAFTRAMKDPFPPARIAAVLSLSATQQFYSLVEVANRVLPSLCLLTCDPEKEVRDQSFKAIRGFLEKLEKASENPETIPDLEAQVQAGGKGGLLSSDKVPQWASWALKSLSGRFIKSAAPSEPKKAEILTNPGSESSIEHLKTDSKAEDVPKSVSVSSSGSNDGWGDLGDEGFEAMKIEKEENRKDKNPLNEDDRSSNWEQKTSSVLRSEKPVVEHKRRGRIHSAMKLNSAVRRDKDDDFNTLFGISDENPKPARESIKSSESDISQSLGRASLEAQDGDKQTSVDSGWDDFDVNVEEPNRSPTKGLPSKTDWETDDWSANSFEPLSAVRPLESKKIRRAEIATCNEAKRKELAGRKTAKGRNVISSGSKAQ